MPIEFYNLGFTMAHAENAQAMQNLFYSQARGGNEVAAARSQDAAKEQQNLIVQDTHEVENSEISGDGRGAHSFQLTKEEEEQTSEQPPEEKKPIDPTGKGQVLDVTM